MLNPIDTDAVIRHGGAVGQFPGEIHEGVAWWVASCFVVITKAERLAVAYDNHPTTQEFLHRFCRGAINAQHYACTVSTLAGVEKDELLRLIKEHAPLAGAYLHTSSGPDGADTVHISLYDENGHLLDEENGLDDLRRMIAEDRVPIPVNDQAKGHIEQHSTGAAQ